MNIINQHFIIMDKQMKIKIKKVEELLYGKNAKIMNRVKFKKDGLWMVNYQKDKELIFLMKIF